MAAVRDAEKHSFFPAFNNNKNAVSPDNGRNSEGLHNPIDSKKPAE